MTRLLEKLELNEKFNRVRQGMEKRGCTGHISMKAVCKEMSKELGEDSTFMTGLGGGDAAAAGVEDQKRELTEADLKFC